MNIRGETSDDTPAIRRVAEAAFAQSDEADLIDALRAAGDIALSLVAEDGDRILGQVTFSRLQAPSKCLAIGPVSVHPDNQSKGIGSELIRKGLELAKNADWQAVFLLGEPAYYERFGFSVDAAAEFETPYPKPYFMALELVTGSLEHLSGDVSYASAFLALD